MVHDHGETGAGLDLAGVCVVARDTRNTSGGRGAARAVTPRCGRRDGAAATSRGLARGRFLVGPAQDQARTAPGQRHRDRAGTAAPDRAGQRHRDKAPALCERLRRRAHDSAGQRHRDTSGQHDG